MEAFSPSITLPFSYTTFANSSSSSGGICGNSMIRSTPWMDDRIWSRLPQRLMDRVIAFLPPPAFFRARTVCKRWYSLLFSTAFLQLCLQVSPPCRHWFIFFKQNTLKTSVYRSSSNGGAARSNCEAYLFDPYDAVWYCLPCAPVPQGFSPASSSGGLVCWVSDEAGSKSVVLWNPLVGSMTALPPTLRPRLFPSVGMAVMEASIDVAVAGDDLISPYAVKNLTTERFHVDGGGFYSMWGLTSSLPRLCSLESGGMVYNNGRFYCMNYSPFSVLAYDAAANEWSKIQAPMRRFLRSPSLVESGGRLILVAAVEKSKLNVPRSLRLWDLQACGANWVEMERMPQQLYAEFAEVEGGRGFDCVGHGDFIVLMIRGGPSPKALLFHFRTKTWLWMPPCPFGGPAQLHGFAYHPTLATPITTLLDHFTLPLHSTFNG